MAQLLTGLDWRWFVLPAAVLLMIVTVFVNFDVIRTIFLVVGLLLLTYVATAFLAHPDWGEALRATFIPRLPTGLPQVESAMALLGTTIGPYLLFWQAEEEKEEHRDRRQFVLAELFGWPSGLSRSPGEARAFYGVMAAAFLSGALAALLGVDPIVALFDSQILDGLLMPAMIVLIFLLVNDRRTMGAERNPPYYNVWLVISFVVLAAGAVWLLAGLV